MGNQFAHVGNGRACGIWSRADETWHCRGECCLSALQACRETGAVYNCRASWTRIPGGFVRLTSPTLPWLAVSEPLVLFKHSTIALLIERLSSVL